MILELIHRQRVEFARIVAGLLALALLVQPTRADKPVLRPADLQRKATHIVEGKVLTISQRTSRKGDTKTIRYVAKIKVGEVVKGTGVKPGDIFPARYWQTVWLGKGQAPPDAANRYFDPAQVGAKVRVYVGRDHGGVWPDDGGFNVLFPNGFKTLRPAPSE